MSEKVMVRLNLKPTKIDLSYIPRPIDRDFDVTAGGRLSVSKEVIEHLSPAEERVKAILESLEKEGTISLRIEMMPTGGMKGFSNRKKRPAIMCEERTLEINDTVNREKIRGFLGI
jgi:hypothetical protein